MFSLDPEKLFIVLIVALVLLGPDKLPKLARQLGAGWSKLREFQQRVESEVRETMPDLPSTSEIARIARSPMSYLSSLADSNDELVADPALAERGGDTEGGDGSWPVDRGAPAEGSNGHRPADGALRPIAVRGADVPADPGMN